MLNFKPWCTTKKKKEQVTFYLPFHVATFKIVYSHFPKKKKNIKTAINYNA